MTTALRRKVSALRGEGSPKRVRPHVKTQRSQKNRGDVPGMTEVGGGAGHGQVCRSAMRQRGEHGSDPAKMDIGYADADGYRGKDHQHIFKNADPSDCPNA